jgi:hypothetical protein
MRKIVLPFAAMALVVLLPLGVSSSMPKDAEALTVKPNFVFILADDPLRAQGQGHEFSEGFRLKRCVLPFEGHHHERTVLP